MSFSFITQRLNDTRLTSEKKRIQLILQKKNKKFCLGLHYNGGNSSLFANGTEIIKFKAKYSETVTYPLCLGNISK